MPPTLLIVDGRDFPRPLVERLEASGYVCLHARGPLRARELLSQHTVDLILWKDNAGNPDLSAELLAEWRAHGGLPVLRVFPKGQATPPGALAGGDAALAGNVPAQTPDKQLAAWVGRCLEQARGGPALAGSGNELAFRHLVTTLRADDAPVPGSAGGLLPEAEGPSTALGEHERELLREGARRGKLPAGLLPVALRRVWQRVTGLRGTAPA